MRFGWLTAAIAALFVAPAAVAQTGPVSGFFPYTGGQYSASDFPLPTGNGPQRVYFPLATQMNKPGNVEIVFKFSVPGNWAVNYDYFLDTHMYNIDKNNCEYCDDAIFGGPSASGYGDSGSIRVWSAWYQSSPKPGYEWSYAIFPNDMYYYYDMLYPTNSLFVFQSDDYRGVVNWTAFARYVPEPATWALMILGFGAVGGALRRERSKRDRLAYA